MHDIISRCTVNTATANILVPEIPEIMTTKPGASLLLLVIPAIDLKYPPPWHSVLATDLRKSIIFEKIAMGVRADCDWSSEKFEKQIMGPKLGDKFETAVTEPKSEKVVLLESEDIERQSKITTDAHNMVLRSATEQGYKSALLRYFGILDDLPSTSEFDAMVTLSNVPPEEPQQEQELNPNDDANSAITQHLSPTPALIPSEQLLETSARPKRAVPRSVKVTSIFVQALTQKESLKEFMQIRGHTTSMFDLLELFINIQRGSAKQSCNWPVSQE